MWTHLDNGSCSGQAVGVRTRLESGLSGFIPTKMISDKHISSPHERVKVTTQTLLLHIFTAVFFIFVMFSFQAGMTLHCRVTRVNMERFQLDLTCRSSDLADKEGKFRYIKLYTCLILYTDNTCEADRYLL